MFINNVILFLLLTAATMLIIFLLIKHFLVLVHNYSSAASDESEYYECVVCLSQVNKGDKIRCLPICNHRFHFDCIALWLNNHSTCPLCRDIIIIHNDHFLLRYCQNSRAFLISLFQGVLHFLQPKISHNFHSVH